MRIAISNIADKFKLKFKRLLYDLGPEVLVARDSSQRPRGTYPSTIGSYNWPLLYSISS